MNSFKQFYFNRAGQFFSDTAVVEAVFLFHEKMVGAIRQKDANEAAGIMKDILVHGEVHLKRMIEQDFQGAKDK